MFVFWSLLPGLYDIWFWGKFLEFPNSVRDYGNYLLTVYFDNILSTQGKAICFTASSTLKPIERWLKEWPFRHCWHILLCIYVVSCKTNRNFDHSYWLIEGNEQLLDPSCVARKYMLKYLIQSFIWLISHCRKFHHLTSPAGTGLVLY